MCALLVLYITVDQETAVKELFASNAWEYNNLGTFLSEHVKRRVLSALELSKKTGSSSSTERTLLEEHADENIEAKVAAKDLNREGKSDSENEEVVTDVKSKVKTRPRKCKQNNILLNKCKNSFFTKKANQRSISKCKNNADVLSKTISVEKRSRKQVKELDIDQTLHSKKVDRRKTFLNTCSSKEGKDNVFPADLDKKLGETIEESVKQDEDTDSRKRQNIRKCKEEKKIEVNGHESGISNISEQNSVGKGYSCDKCSYTTNNRSNLNRHVREIHSGVRYECTKCNKTFKGKHNAKMHDMYAHNSALHCKECDKTFSSISGLRNHVKIKHKKKTLYQCKHCEMKFFYKSHYLGHVNKHLNVKPFSCKTCQRPFRYKVACHLHERTCSRENFYVTHNSDGSLKQTTKSKFLCDICGLALTSKSGLKSHHYYTHTDDTTTVCSLCGKSFKGTYSLQRHTRNVHESTGKVFPCPDCGKEFMQQQILRQHMKIHKKAYTCYCETCGKGFLSRFKMIEHSRTHTGEKPFSCPHCQNFKCATKTNLQKHLKIHKEGRVPRQKKEKEQKKWKTSEGKEDKCEKTTLHMEEVFIPLNVSTDLQTRSTECTQEEVTYTNLPQMVLDKSLYNQSKCSNTFDHLYDTEQYNQKEGDHTDAIRGSSHSVSNRHQYVAYEMSMKNIARDDGEPENLGDFQSENARGRNVCSGYYGNDTANETSELPQGLNILTVAMNIVNPSDY